MRIGIADIPACPALTELHKHIVQGKLRDSEIYALAIQNDESLPDKLKMLVECTYDFKQFQDSRNLVTYFKYAHCVGMRLCREKHEDWVKCASEHGKEGGDIKKCEYKKKLINTCLKESAEDLLRGFKAHLHRRKR